MIRPLFKPESSPSVTIATRPERPAPFRAAAKLAAKTVPGPPRGPRPRSTITSPSRISLRHSGELDNGPVRSEAAADYLEPGFPPEWIVQGTDDPPVRRQRFPQDLGDRLAGHCYRARVQARRDLLHHSPSAAGFLQLPYTVGSVGPNYADKRCVLGSLLKEAGDVQIELCFGRHGGEVADRVHGPPDGEVDLDGVREGHGGEHVPSTQILLHHLHDTATGRSGEIEHLLAPRANGRVARQRHAKYLGEHVHGVRRCKPSAHPRGLDRRLRHLAELF